MLAQGPYDHPQVHRIGQCPAESMHALFIGLHAPEENIIHKALQTVACRVQRQRQDEHQQSDE